jgi:hypothetical protein
MRLQLIIDLGYDGYQIDTQENDVYFLIDDWEYTIQGLVLLMSINHIH